MKELGLNGPLVGRARQLALENGGLGSARCHTQQGT
jgi:hypothetical protein